MDRGVGGGLSNEAGQPDLRVIAKSRRHLGSPKNLIPGSFRYQEPPSELHEDWIVSTAATSWVSTAQQQGEEKETSLSPDSPMIQPQFCHLLTMSSWQVIEASD